MTDKFVEAQKIQKLQTLMARMGQAVQNMASFNQGILDCAAIWQGYAAIEDDAESLSATSNRFAASTRESFDAQKTGFALSLDILASRMLDGQGQPLTRDALLGELATVPPQS